MYQLLSGQEPDTTPFRFPLLQTLEPTVPARLAMLLKQMLDGDEQKRPVNVVIVEQTLQEISLTNGPVQPFSSFSLPQPVKQQQQRSLRMLGMIFLSICCIVIGGFIGDGVGTSSANTTNRINATAVASAGIDATSTAVQIAALPDPYTPQGTLALVDPLNQPDAWQPQSNTSFGGSCQFTNGRLEIKQKAPSKFYVCDESTLYQNFVIEVKMTIIEGDCGSVIIRNKNDDSQSYPLEICSDGHYYFNRFDEHGKGWIDLSSDHTSAAFKPLGQTNTVGIVANGNTFDLYANGKKIDSITDNTLSLGIIGFSADAPEHNATVLYQDVRIWALP